MSSCSSLLKGDRKPQTPQLSLQRCDQLYVLSCPCYYLQTVAMNSGLEVHWRDLAHSSHLWKQPVSGYSNCPALTAGDRPYNLRPRTARRSRGRWLP